LITALGIKNFKSIKESGPITLKPLTIFTGPNASGKSNILKALAFVAQIARLPRGVSHNFHWILQSGEFLRFSYPIPTNSLVYQKNPRGGISIIVMIGTSGRVSRAFPERLRHDRRIIYEYSYRPETKELRQRLSAGQQDILEFSYTKVDAGGYKSQFTHPPSLLGIIAPRGDEALNLETLKVSQKITPEATKALNEARAVMEILIDQLSKVCFLSAERGRVELLVSIGPEDRQRRGVLETPTWVGRDGEYLIEMLASIFGSKEYSDSAAKIDRWAQSFGIGSILAGWRGKDFLGADFSDPILKTSLELTFASYGSRQLLAMITQLISSEPEAAILIEEPEMSLHPESQILLQEFFAEMIREDKQIICTTHSPFFILALSKVIKSGKLSKDSVRLYHVDKRKTGTIVKPLKLNEQGFVEGWIPSYINVENELFKEWAKGFEQ
jgi:predicted ATPase